MNGKGQFLMNLGITLLFGFYGIVGSLFSEMLKPDLERSGIALAVQLVVGLAIVAFAVHLLRNAYSNMKNDRE